MADLSEHREQAALIQWWALYCRTKHIDESLLFAIPNGGKRTFAVANIMKSEGMRSGVPDLFLAVPHGEYHGMFIEMKRANGGTLQDTQKSYLSLLGSVGYKCVVCHGFEAARDSITRYLA